MFATEKVRIVGDTRIEGKLTVTGALDPTSLTLSAGGTAHFIQWGSGSTAPVSTGVGTARIRYNETLTRFEQSLDGGAYTAFGGGVTFPLLGPADTAAAPNYSWSADSNTGMFNAGADIIGFSAGGTERGRVTTTGFKTLDGSTANPSYSFTSSTNSGMYFEAGAGISTVAFTANGANVIFFVNDGGTIQIKADLDGSAADPMYTFVNANSGMFLSGQDLGFSANGVETFRVTTTGATVTGKLTVTGAIDPTSLTLSGGGTAHFIQWGSGSTAPVSTGVGTARIRYNESLVRFEQSLDGAAYTAFGGAASFPLLAPNDTAGAPSYSWSSDPDMGFYRVAADTVGLSTLGVERMSVSSNGTVVFNETGLATSDFRVEGDTDPNLIFVDASTDFVGIGTSTPTRILEVFRDENAGTIVGVTNPNAVGTSVRAGYVASATGGGSPRSVQMEIFSSLNTASPTFTGMGGMYMGSAGSLFMMVQNPTFHIQFYTMATSERMRILDTGQIEIGQTTNTNGGLLEVNGKIFTSGAIEIDGSLDHDGTTVGFYGTAPAIQQTATGSRGGNAALASLLTALATTGIIVDGTVA